MLSVRNEFLNFFPNCTGSSLSISPQILKGASDKTKIHSALWKFYLLILPNLTNSFAKDEDWIRILKDKRSKFVKLKEKYIKSPNFDNSSFDDPLFSENSETWTETREDQKLKEEIQKDVKRAFQELKYFQIPETLQTLEDILFIFCKTHPEYGYPQGLHEIAAFTLYVMHEEMTLESNDTISFIFSKTAVISDAYSVFEAIAEYIEPFYSLSTSKYSKTYLVEVSEFIQDQIIGKKAPRLAELLKSTNVPPHTYMMKWFRLLFLFVFDFEGVKTVWDVIFSFSPDLRICHYICAAMLINAQTTLLHSDTTETLKLLYRYPVVHNSVTFALEAVLNMPKSKNNKKSNSNDIISTVSERLTELSHKLIEICTKNGYELALPYVMDIGRTRDILLGIIPMNEMLPLDQTVEMFKPQPEMTLDIKPEEESKNDNQLNLIENPNVKTNPRSKESQIGDQKILFGDDNNDLFSTQLANPSSLPSSSNNTLFDIQDEIAKPIKKTKHPVKVKDKSSTMKTTKKEHKPVQSNKPHNKDMNMHAHNKDPLFDDDIPPLQKEEVKSKPKERLKNTFF